MQEVPDLDSMIRHIHGLTSDKDLQLPRLKKQAKDLIFTMDSTGREGTAKSTAKIADYLNIYGSRSRSSSKTKRSTGSVRKSEDSKVTLTAISGRRFSRPPRSTAMSSSVKEPMKENAGEIKKKVENLEHLVAGCKSDRFELKRDIATYEHGFSAKFGLEVKLAQLNSIASSLPDIFESFNGLSAEEQNVFNRIQADIKQLSLINTRVIDQTALALQENFGFKPLRARKNQEYFRGVHTVSGLHCIVVIVGDDIGERFNVKLQTMAGEEFGIVVRHKLAVTEVTTAVIREQLLPFFYLTISEGDLKLNFDTRCSTEFLTLLTELKGSPEYLNTIILTQEDDIVFLTLLDPPAELKIPKAKITEEPKLFNANISKVQRLITSHLVYVKGSGDLIWSSKSRVQSHVYSYKHQVSKLLDEAYVREIIEADFTILSASEFTILGRQFRLEVLGYRNSFKLKIASEDKIIELPSNSQEIKLLQQLQGLSLKNFATLSKSLELGMVVSKLFPKRSVIN